MRGKRNAHRVLMGKPEAKRIFFSLGVDEIITLI